MAKIETLGGIFLLLLTVGLIYWLYKKGVGGVAQSAVTAIGNVAVGGVKGVAQTVGIPDTNTDQCQADLKAGKIWDASFSCSAGTYLKGLFNKVFDTNPLPEGQTNAQ